MVAVILEGTGDGAPLDDDFWNLGGIEELGTVL